MGIIRDSALSDVVILLNLYELFSWDFLDFCGLSQMGIVGIQFMAQPSSFNWEFSELCGIFPL